MRKSIAISAIIVTLSLLIPTTAHASPTSTQEKELKQIRLETQFNPLIILDCNDPLYLLQLENVAKTKSKKDGEVTLKCGTPGYGYVHIRKKHEKEWKTVTSSKKVHWDDTMWTVTKKVLSNPSFTLVQKGNKRCYTAPVKLKGSNGKMGEFFPSVIVATDKKRIITSVPTREHMCSP
ncbi:hypothetical protein [Brevibacterium oceani]|uniref:hypothetical protein n=1 Tax=Brevibacterium oceani TaxID=358099 RepID=UPI0015E7BD70|nr:hypothetical protein [Brevibacterium oceani]